MSDDRMPWARGLLAASEVEAMLCEALSVSADKAQFMMREHLKSTGYAPSPAGKLYSRADVRGYLNAWSEFFISSLRLQELLDQAQRDREVAPAGLEPTAERL